MEKTRADEVRTLAQIVSSWQPSRLTQIADEFSKSCKSSLLTFSGFDAYKAYFEPLLFAELAAECAAAADKFLRSPPLRAQKIRSRREDPGTALVPVTVKKVLPIKTPCKYAVDLDPLDERGPVGCSDGDVVTVWRAEGKISTSKSIPPKAVLATVTRPFGKHGVRVTLDTFPDGDAITGQDLEEGEEVEGNIVNAERHWFLLRLASVVTLRREHEAVLNIKSSPLLSALLKPNDDAGFKNSQLAAKEVLDDTNPAHPGRFTQIVKNSMGLNPAQVRAVEQASKSTGGFTVVQGPPGTGKTRTLIALLNVVHISQYQEYYETLVSSVKHNTQKIVPHQGELLVTGRKPVIKKDPKLSGSLLESLIAVMHKTNSAIHDEFEVKAGMRTRRPRLLVCAPSNSAVDEVLTRLLQIRFLDGQGERYIPEVVRVGNGDRVADSAKNQTAEKQAEMFLNQWCSTEKTPEEQRKLQFRELSNWQSIANKLIEDLRRLPKREDNCDVIVKLHEQLERMERNLRRLGIAGSTKLSREEKLRNIARTIVEDAQIVFSTLSGAASKILMPRGITPDKKEASLFDTVIIDEAAQSTEPSCLVPLILGAERCLLVGDPQQLPATVLSAGNAGAAYGQSLLDRICRAGKKMLLLDTQYRMHPAISSFPRRHFYDGKLLDDVSVQDENRSKPCHHDDFKPRLGPYVFLNVSDGEEKRSWTDRSIFNEQEAELAVKIYKKLKADYPNDVIFSPEGKTPGSSKGFGVITPYKSQMQVLRQAFDRAGVSTGDIEIDTVDAFQGREKDVVIFSCVRSSVKTGIGFVRDVRRMNVGLTRARSSLIVLGNAQALSEGSADWAALVEDARSRGCLIPVADVKSIFQQPSSDSVVHNGSISSDRDPRIRKIRGQQVTPGPSSSRMTQETGYQQQQQQNVATNGEHGEVMGTSVADDIEAAMSRFIEAAKSSNLVLSDETVQNVRQQIVKANGHCDIETLLAVILTSTKGKAFAQDLPSDTPRGTNGAPIKVALRSVPVSNPNKEMESDGKRRIGRPTIVKEEVQESSGWAMALGSSNSDRKRTSQEAMQDPKRSDEPQGGGRGVVKFRDGEVRETQKRARLSGAEGMQGRQHEHYNRFDKQPTQDLRQVTVQQNTYMGEASGQMQPGMIGTSPSGYGAVPYGQPLGMTYGATSGQGLTGNAVAQHQMYMQNMQNGALTPYPPPMMYPQQQLGQDVQGIGIAPHLMGVPPPQQPHGFVSPPMFPPQFVPMAPAGPMGNNGSWGRGERRDPRHSHRGRARNYRQRGGYSRPYDQR